MPARQRLLAAVASSLVALGCCGMAVRAYVGANYQLKYRVCGGAQQSFGLTRRIILGIRIVNPNGETLYAKINKVVFTVNGRSADAPTSPEIVPLVDDAHGDPARMSAFINYDPPFENPPKVMTGRVRYEIQFGFKKEEQNRPLLIDGTFTLGFAEKIGVNGTEFRFTPSAEATDSYVGSCEPDDFIRPLAD